MKKIKSKSKSKLSRSHRPALLVGFSGDVPPGGYLAAWYNEHYGGPLHIRFLHAQSQSLLEASHVDWKAEVRLESTPQEVETWQTQIGWDHTGVAQVLPVSRVGVSRIDVVLFLARLGRGLTLLTGGTTYDVASQLYWNPSDWIDRPLIGFCIEDHVQVYQDDSTVAGRQWFVTRGMAKFGLEELEVFRPSGLPERPTKERLEALADVCIQKGKSPKVGEVLLLPDGQTSVRVIRHRTVALPSGQLNVREVSWDGSS